MAGRNINRLHTVLGAQRRTDSFTFINHRHPTAALCIGLIELAHQHRFGATDCWPLQQQSGVPLEKSFRTLQLDRFPLAIQQQVERLRSGAFLDEAVNVLAVGKPGTGKSHLVAALSQELLLHGHRVLWTATATLVQRLLAAKRDLRLPQFLSQLDRYACIVLDDIGYVQHDRDEMEVLFTLLAERYERKSVMITTNLVFSDWTRIFKDPMTTMAAIDRVVHHSVILDLMGLDSYRAKEANDKHHSARSTSVQ